MTITINNIFETLVNIFEDEFYHGIMMDNWNEDDDEQHGLNLTFATNDDTTLLNWQSGDNSFTGNAYSLPHWGTCCLHPEMSRLDIASIAEYVADQLEVGLPSQPDDQVNYGIIKWEDTKYQITFEGRKTGAIGSIYDQTIVIEAKTIDHAMKVFYCDYEHQNHSTIEIVEIKDSHSKTLSKKEIEEALRRHRNG